MAEFTILMVDDEKLNLDILQAILAPQKYRLLTAESGTQAIARATAVLPDLILLDIVMPGMNGFQVIQALQANPATRAIPIVVVSMLEQSGQRAEALKLGADDFLTKPIDRIELLARVKSTLEKKRLRDRQKAYLQQVEQEKERSDALLLNIFPQSVVAQLKNNQQVIAENHPDTTVLFADIVGFSEMSDNMAPKRLVARLNHIFSAFDEMVAAHGLEKIKTIGDAYMLAGGLNPEPRDHTQKVAAIALDLMQEIRKHSDSNGNPLRLRIGINTGPVTAGVVGAKRFIYDLWGDTVNVASRMESLGLPGMVQVSHPTYRRLKARYRFEKRGSLYVKGKGEMPAYFLIGTCSGKSLQLKTDQGRARSGAGAAWSLAMDEIDTLPLTDDLTGLYARSGLGILLRQMRSEANRKKRAIHLLLVRLANLKQINREAGYGAGDQGLRAMADLLRATFRASDLIGRLGGNQMLVCGTVSAKIANRPLSDRLSAYLGGDRGPTVAGRPLSITYAEARWQSQVMADLDSLLGRMELEL